jgi:UrcA family protein
MRKSVFLSRSAIVLSTLLAISAPAVAESVIVTTNPAPRATVSITDFNLSSADGVARLKNRIKAAAADLCLTSAVEPVGMRVARAKCYRSAVSSGYRQVDHMVAAPGRGPTLTAAMIGQ